MGGKCPTSIQTNNEKQVSHDERMYVVCGLKKQADVSDRLLLTH